MTISNAVEFTMTRLFDAPRALVWQAFTEVERLKRWWGPKGFTMPSCQLDLRPGGVFQYGMRSPDGHDMWGKWVFCDLVAPERLVMVVSFCDASGSVARHPMSPTWPLRMLGIASFTDQGGKTLLTNRTYPFDASQEECSTFVAGFDSMKQGFGGTWDQLAGYLASA